jgi:tRNA-specific 2-thiouridylase
MDIAARVRSTRAPRAGTIRLVDGAPVVELRGSEDGVAPGQACVLYTSDEPDARVLGGGTILCTSKPAAVAA